MNMEVLLLFNSSSDFYNLSIICSNMKNTQDKEDTQLIPDLQNLLQPFRGKIKNRHTLIFIPLCKYIKTKKQSYSMQICPMHILRDNIMQKKNNLDRYIKLDIEQSKQVKQQQNFTIFYSYYYYYYYYYIMVK